jgi:hypothetical protein
LFTFQWIRGIALVGTLAIALTGCTSSTTTLAGDAVDIRNAVLTNTSGDCADYSAAYQAEVTDIERDMGFVSQFDVSEDGESCSVTANVVPNYDFNDGTGRFVEPVAEQNLSLKVPRNATVANSTSGLSLLMYNAVMLNGVVLDQVANGCYMPNDASADEDGNIANGCGLWVDWRLDPLGAVSLGADSHNGHTQPGGMYHYHGDPHALYDPQATDQVSPVIGFAADGFPIYGPHHVDPTSGAVRDAVSGYTLKEGSRPDGDSSPGGTYDGTYIQDYEFTDAGTLDECNGMTVDGQYGYYVADSYPYVMGCYTGTPDLSFFKFWDIAWWILGGFLAFVAIITLAIVLLVRRLKKKKAAAQAGLDPLEK